MTLDPQTWLERYKRRFMAVAGLDDAAAEACATAESFEVRD